MALELLSAAGERFARRSVAGVLEGEGLEAWVEVLRVGGAGRKAVVYPRGRVVGLGGVRVSGPVEWAPGVSDWVAAGEQVGKWRAHEEGWVYALDGGSVFEGGLMGSVRRGGRVLDLCAAPGGKSVLAWSLVGPEELVSNEVIGKRQGMLRSNLERCGVGARVERLDPGVWASESAEGFEGVVVDAPCSGQSLLARGVANPGCFHPDTVRKNALRQRRILASGGECVQLGGWLLYCTCTFAREENEGVVEWFLGQRGDFREVVVGEYGAWRGEVGYRLWPMEGKGAGGFACLMRRE